MANLHITEMTNLPSVDGEGVVAIDAASITQAQVVAIGVSSANSAAFYDPPPTLGPIDMTNKTLPTRWLMLVAGANCAVAFSSVSANLAANANSTPIIVGQPPVFVQVPTGWQCAVIQLTP